MWVAARALPLVRGRWWLEPGASLPSPAALHALLASALHTLQPREPLAARLGSLLQRCTASAPAGRPTPAAPALPPLPALRSAQAGCTQPAQRVHSLLQASALQSPLSSSPPLLLPVPLLCRLRSAAACCPGWARFTAVSNDGHRCFVRMMRACAWHLPWLAGRSVGSNRTAQWPFCPCLFVPGRAL
jgi:hypothetical protein